MTGFVQNVLRKADIAQVDAVAVAVPHIPIMRWMLRDHLKGQINDSPQEVASMSLEASTQKQPGQEVGAINLGKTRDNTWGVQ
ncbi:unnamed protein product [Prunus armeniaca]